MIPFERAIHTTKNEVSQAYAKLTKDLVDRANENLAHTTDLATRVKICKLVSQKLTSLSVLHTRAIRYLSDIKAHTPEDQNKVAAVGRVVVQMHSVVNSNQDNESTLSAEEESIIRDINRPTTDDKK